MKTSWAILIISALTDCLIVVVNGLTSAMMATGVAAIPNRAVIMVNVLLGLAALARTIQQALKATPDTSAALRGQPSVTSTVTEIKTP